MMIVGEAPGEDEAAALLPFIGGSGKILSAMLQHAGIERRHLFVTNVVKCRPTARGAAGKIVNRPPTETEILHCAKFLVGELNEVNPNVVVAMGNIPLHTLTDAKKGITVMRSVPLEGPKRKKENIREAGPTTYKVVPTLHPANVMRQQHMWPAVVFDLVRARNESAFPSIVRRPWRNIIHADLSAVADGLRRRIKEHRIAGVPYGFYGHDLETTGLDPSVSAVRCIGIAAEPSEVYVFDWTGGVQQFVAELHADPDLITVGQNSEGFDIPYQEYKGFDFKGPTYDTMIGWHLLNSALPKDLGFIGATCTDEPYWKDDTMYKSGEDALQYGCGKDVHATVRAFEDQILELQQLNQDGLYFNQIMPLQPVLRAMTKRGLKKDMRRAAGWHAVLIRKADELEARLKKGLGDSSFNIDSPKQLMDLLYTRMGLPIQYKPDRERGQRPTVDADALDQLALIVANGSDPHLKAIAPLFKLVRAIRTYRKWDATFIQCPHDINFYTHPHFGSAKAATGRLNSWDPNMQNWPDEVRDIIIPDDKDCVLMGRDWSGIEWRIAMTLSGDRVGLDALAAGRDPHSDAYAQAFGKAYEEVTKSERFEAKTINYGLLYGRSDASLALGRPGHPESAIPIDRVSGYSQAFLRKFEGYYQMREDIKRRVIRDHFIATAWGRRRWWYTRQQLPEAFNYPMQGNAAHMMYIALIELERQLPKGATLRATIHDECLVHAHKDVVKLADECMKDVMEMRFKEIEEHSQYPDIVRHYYPNGWYCPTDGHLGMTWRACKPETEEQKVEEKRLRKYLGML